LPSFLAAELGMPAVAVMLLWWLIIFLQFFSEGSDSGSGGVFGCEVSWFAPSSCEGDGTFVLPRELFLPRRQLCRWRRTPFPTVGFLAGGGGSLFLFLFSQIDSQGAFSVKDASWGWHQTLALAANPVICEGGRWILL
jgi:hypothetical protein